LAKIQREQDRLLERGIRINYVTPIVAEGQKLGGLGSRVYYNRPPQETFHEFILSILHDVLGKEWREEQTKTTEKHYLMTCFEAARALMTGSQAQNQPVPEIKSTIVDGPTKYLLSVAFDVCSLIHAQRLPEDLIARLRGRNEFQGARYELGIAAIFARLGYTIEFLNDPSATEKHCEFYATDPTSGESIAVEAKSRRRPGVLHMEGERSDDTLLRAGVARHIREAAQQGPGDRPFLIFIDINSPHAEVETINETWRPEILKVVNEQYPASPDNPTPFTAVYVTNFPFHYDGASTHGGAGLEIRSPYPKHSLKDERVFEFIMRACKYYGDVPSFDVDGVLGWD
jgi:hypothetical protein